MRRKKETCMKGFVLIGLWGVFCVLISLYGTAIMTNAETLSESKEETEAAFASVAEEISLLPECNDSVRICEYDDAYAEALCGEEAAAASYDSTTLELVGIAAYLSNSDGLPATALLAIEAEGNGAKEDAADWVTDGVITSEKEDSARHFLWNFRSVKNVLATEEETRIFVINYEWADQLLEAWQSKYEVRLAYYLSCGYDEETAAGGAECDADDYVLTLKQSYESKMLTSFSKFYNYFGEDSIMDFYNDAMGREYTESFNFLQKKKAYLQAVSDGKICICSDDVTSAFAEFVWEELTYWYIG